MPPTERDNDRGQLIALRVVRAGWVCLLLSAIFLQLSKTVDPDGGFAWAIYLMAARLFGMSAFAIGGVAIYNHRWTEGILMLLLAVILPVLAFVVHGTI